MMNKYDGILRKPFLSEHWHKGIVASLAMWLPVFYFVSEIFDADMNFAVGVATFVSVVIAMGIFTYHEGFELDFEKRQYRNYIWILSLHFGQWKLLPPISQVVVRQYQAKHYLTMTDNSDKFNSGFTATERGWQVMLSVIGSPIGIIAACTTGKEASQIADTLSKMIGVEISK